MRAALVPDSCIPMEEMSELAGLESIYWQTIKEHVEQGGLVVYNTDTLWGLGCNPEAKRGRARIQQAKGTPEQQPVAVALPLDHDLWKYLQKGQRVSQLYQKFLPGPLTLVGKTSEQLPVAWEQWLGKEGLLGIRIPAHGGCQELLHQVGPLVTTSANLHGQPPCQTKEEARNLAEKLREKSIPTLFVMRGEAPAGSPSTVVKVTDEKPKVLRWGLIGPKDLQEALD